MFYFFAVPYVIPTPSLQTISKDQGRTQINRLNTRASGSGERVVVAGVIHKNPKARLGRSLDPNRYEEGRRGWVWGPALQSFVCSAGGIKANPSVA